MKTRKCCNPGDTRIVLTVVLGSYSYNANLTAMKVQKAGKRGVIFTFDDNISLFLVTGTRVHVLCDTHLGPLSMDEMKENIGLHIWPDRMVIFNSHSDWDHVWGNCAFPESYIIGHESCRLRMRERGEFDLAMNRQQVRGDVRIIPPNLTFSERLILEDEDIEFLYAPGHTSDSSICHDREDGILYLGDLVEDPIPYLDFADLEIYLATLRMILGHEACILVSAHSGVVTRDLVRKNISYITAVRDGENLVPSAFGEYEQVHRWNMNQRIFLQYEQQARDIFGGRYSPVHLLELAGDLHGITPDELHQKLALFLSRVSSG